jgi:hypothetical protein
MPWGKTVFTGEQTDPQQDLLYLLPGLWKRGREKSRQTFGQGGVPEPETPSALRL